MRVITTNLTPILEEHNLKKQPFEASPFIIDNYKDLVRFVAQLAYLNKDHLLFFRGQSEDFLNRANSSTIYPSIYRGDYLKHEEVFHRFQILEEASRQLMNIFEKCKITGYQELIRKKYIQYSLLQHYGVCETPLLDLTHSLDVACSFAQQFNNSNYAYVFVFGLPYITNRISYNSEHDLVNIRLLSISPPDALRPYFQDGYLAGTTDITTEYFSKTELDFKNRLIAKFKIPNDKHFWSKGFSCIPEEVLFPKDDKVGELCKEISLSSIVGKSPEEGLGAFLISWRQLEKRLVSLARKESSRVRTVTSALAILKKAGLDSDIASRINHLRIFRNSLIHDDKQDNHKILENQTQHANEVLEFLNNNFI